jgi:hypothetical protein
MCACVRIHKQGQADAAVVVLSRQKTRLGKQVRKLSTAPPRPLPLPPPAPLTPSGSCTHWGTLRTLVPGLFCTHLALLSCFDIHADLRSALDRIPHGCHVP